MYSLFDWSGEKALDDAIRIKSDNLVLKLLYEGARPTGAQMLNALGWAQSQTIKQMAMRCKNVNETCMYGYSPFTGYLISCAQKGGFVPSNLPIAQRSTESFDEVYDAFMDADADVYCELYETVTSEWSDSDEFRKLMERNNKYIPDYLGCTPLHLIASIGNLGAAEEFLRVGADVNAKTLTGTTPLMWAVEQNHVEMAQFLIEQGAQVNHQSVANSVKKLDHPGATALSIAVDNEAFECMELLLRHGANARLNYSLSDGKIMCAAAQTGNLDVLLGLSKDGFTVQNGKYNPLAAAVKNPECLTEEMLDWFYKQGVDFNEKNEKGLTPLHCYLRRVFAGKSLSPYFVFEIKENGQRVLMHDVKRDIVSKMLQYGADINSQDNFAKTLLCDVRLQSDIDFLIENGADISIKNKAGLTPLMHLARISIAEEGSFLSSSERLPLIVRLMEYGADINEQDNEGKTILHYIETIRDLEFLVKNGADVSIKDNDGKVWSDYVPEHMRKRVVAICELYQKEAAMLPNSLQKIAEQNKAAAIAAQNTHEKENM